MKRKRRKVVALSGDPDQAKTDVDVPNKTFDESAEKATYEIGFEAPNCTDSDIIECFNVNYEDELKCKKINNDDKNFRIFKSNSKHVIKKINGIMTNLQVFHVEVFNKESVKKVLELFSEEYMFDHNAFKNHTEDRFVRLKKINRIQ